MNSKLVLKDGTEYEGISFGAEKSVNGEVVFATGMVGYPESLTDPSFRGQILVYTFPLIGNYGVPDKKFWESNKLQISALIVCNYNSTPSHYSAKQTLSAWLKKEGIPALEIKDTRGLTLKLRDHGVMLGKIVSSNSSLRGVPTSSELQGSGRHGNLVKTEIASTALAMTGAGFEDPNLRNLAAEVSTKKVFIVEPDKKAVKLKKLKTVVVIDCGNKNNIVKCLTKRGVKVIVVPWNANPLKLKNKIDGVLVSNGPGDPQMVKETIENVKLLLKKKVPTLGICLGHQILALAAGGTTYKLKFGHRAQNQPCVLSGSKKAYLTTQNHGFAVKKIPNGFKEWFYNANDETNEGIIHKSLPFMSVQFHPEATPGPVDTDWIFDEFIKTLK